MCSRPLTIEETGLDDLCVRFIINLPQEELESVERICFQVEEAQWFYEDFIRPLDPELPSLNLRNFCLRIFQHCPLLSGFSSYHHTAAFSEFLAYKTRVPVRGAILLNHDMDQVILVKGWKKSANWSFPRGKINKDEADLDCAIREVYEETGFNLRDAGLLRDDENMKYIDVTMREQQLRLYVFPGIPMDAHFAPRTRKEISKIQWYKLSELPTLKKQKQQQEGQNEELVSTASKFYMVAPFMVPLKKWISQQKKIGKSRQLNKTPVPSDTINLSEITSDNQPTVNGFSKPIAMNEEEITSAHLRHDISEEPISDLPEVSEPRASMNDPAAELKSILKVPLRDPSESLEPAITKASMSLKSSALLALLKVGSASKSDELPQTPSEQIIRSARMPASPKHHHQHLQHLQGQRQLPTYLSSTVLDRGGNATVPTQEPLMPVLDTGRESHQQTVIPNHGPLRKNPQSSINMNAPESQVSLKNAPPYQITGDPQFAQNPHIPSRETSSLPQANKIPPPKPTTQASLLLGLFKNQQMPAAVASTSLHEGQANTPGLEPVAVEGNPLTTSKHEERYTELLDNPKVSAGTSLVAKLAEHSPIRAESMNGPGFAQEECNHRHVRVQDAIPIPKMLQTAESPLDSKAPLPKTENVERNVSALATSEHKKSLLSLFKRPSYSKTEGLATVSSNTLELPSVLAELSAFPSPGHSREPSQMNTGPLSNASSLTDIAHNLTLPHEKPFSDPKPKRAPVFATINGPLNVPIFEVLSRASKESKAASDSNNLTDLVDRSPTIFESPSANHQEILLKPKQSSLTTPVAAGRKSDTQPLGKIKTAHPMPFRPQMSRPSHEDLITSLQNVAAPRGTQATSLSRPDPTDEPQGNSHDHKEILLSLFNKSSHATEPKNPATITSILSPLSERSQADPASSYVISPLTARSRMGSIASTIGERNGSAGGESPLPRTTPGHKSLLLGYLDRVVKKERGNELC